MSEITSKDRRPNWDMWRLMPSATLQELIALSMDIDPKKVQYDHDAWMRGVDSPAYDEADEFVNRAEIIRRNASSFEVVSLSMSHVDKSTYTVRSFVRWILTTRLTVPPELASLLGDDEWLFASSGHRFPGAESNAEPLPVGDRGRHFKREALIANARSNPLAAVIRRAEVSSLDATDWNSVWAEIVKMAQSPQRPAPLLGYVEGEGVKYSVDGVDSPVQFLRRDAFRKRHERKPN